MNVPWQDTAAFLEDMGWILSYDMGTFQTYKDPHNSSNIFILDKRTDYTIKCLRNLFYQHGIDNTKFLIRWHKLHPRAPNQDPKNPPRSEP